jgi:hypothetical protein
MVKRKQHIGTFLHNEMAISVAGMSPMCDRSSMPRQKIFFLRSIATFLLRFPLPSFLRGLGQWRTRRSCSACKAAESQACCI